MTTEITKPEVQSPMREKIIWLLFALLIVFVYFFGLTIPLLGPDEPRYAQVAREMFERADWITPTLGGFDWFEKPALLYWLQIVAYKLFGVSEFAARFGSAVFGLGTIASLWILGRNLATENTEKHRETHDTKDNINFSASSVNSVAKKDFANWLALIAASSIGLIAFSRGASFDIVLTFPITAALVCFYIYDSKISASFASSALKYLFGFYFFVGVSLLAKGLIGIVFPAAIVAFYFLLSRKLPNKTFILSLLWGTVLSLIVAAVWYVPMYQANGWKFIDEFFIQHHFQRFTSDKYQHHQPLPFFFLVLPLMTLPWLPFFLLAIWDFVKNLISDFKTRKSSQRSRVSASPLMLFAWAWLLVPLVFFTISGSKLPGYILPALPAALILTAEYVSRFTAKSRRSRHAIQTIAFVTFVVVIAALQFFVPAYAQKDTTKYLIETANANNYSDAKILNMHQVSHNAEFYGAGRLIRNADGKLKIFYGVTEISDEIKRQNGKATLVFVPTEYLYQLQESDLIEAKVLGESGETVLVAVKLK